MKAISRFFVLLGILLLCGALGLAAYNLWDEKRAGDISSGVLDVLEDYTEKAAAEKTASVGEKELEEQPLYKLNPQIEMPAVEVDGHSYVGTLEIPSLSLRLPVMSSWSYPNLRLAPCRYTGTAYQSGFVIAAHNYTTHFGTIKNLQDGDQVIFTDCDGNVFTYAVRVVEVLMPTDTAEMKSTDWDLTLFTCTIGGRSRVTVRCELVSE